MNIVIIPHLPTLYGRRYNLAKGLAAAGHNVHFIIWENPYGLSGGFFAHIRRSWQARSSQDPAGFTVHKIRRMPLFWPFLNGLLFKRQIRHIYNDVQGDLILSQSYTNETEPPLDLPLLYDMNDDHAAFARIYGSPVYKLAYKLLTVEQVVRRQASRARVVSVVSDRLYTLASTFNKNVIKIPNGVEPDALNALSTARPHTIAYVSTFGKWAHGTDVVQAVGELRSTLPGIHLDLVGEGTEMPAIRQKVAELGLENQVTIHGWVRDREKLFNIIRSADVCLNISEKNDFRDAASPMKVIDYSAAGKKVVSTGLAEVHALKLPNVFIYDGQNGIDGMKDALLDAFGSHIDGKKVQGMIRKDYTWDVLLARLLAYWRMPS